MNNIRIEFIGHSQQRYDTNGDWLFDQYGDLIIRVSNDIEPLKSEDAQFLVALHELVEVWLCLKRGISQQTVDDFDLKFLQTECPACGDWAEPGDHSAAPYKNEHRFAMIIEHLMAHELGIPGYGVIK